MDAKSRDLALLALLSLFCAISAWAGDRDAFGSVFFARGAAALPGGARGRGPWPPRPLSGRRAGLKVTGTFAEGPASCPTFKYHIPGDDCLPTPDSLIHFSLQSPRGAICATAGAPEKKNPAAEGQLRMRGLPTSRGPFSCRDVGI